MELLDSPDRQGGGQIILSLLGRVHLCDDHGRRIQSVLSQPKRVALLAYLAMAGRERFVRRDELTVVFWPRRDDQRARKALRDALYFLRRSLGSEVILTPGDEVGLNWKRFECDAVELLEALEVGDEERWKSLYGSEFLPGFHFSGSVAFEEWVDGVRERLAKYEAAVGVEAVDANTKPPNVDLDGMSRARRPARGSTWRNPLIASVVVLLALWGTIATFSSDVEAPRSDLVLVTEFENLTGDPAFDFLGSYASHVLLRGLVDTHLTPAADPERIRQLLIPDADDGTFESRLSLATDLARSLRASFAILGNVLWTEDGPALGAHVVEVGSGAVVASVGPFPWDSLASEASLSELRSRVIGSLASRTAAEVSDFAALERRPPRYEAFREYVIGRRAHHRSRYADEFEAYERAIAIDPDFVQPRLMMLVSYANLAMVAGFNAGPEAMRDPIRKGRQLAEQLSPLRDGMAPAQRFWFDFQRANLLGRHGEARTAAQRLVTALPTEYNQFVYGLAANKAMRFPEAAEALIRIDPDKGEVRGWPFLWFNATWALHQVGNHRQELQMAEEGFRRYPNNQQMLFHEFAALVALDRPQEALEVFSLGWKVDNWPSYGRNHPGGMYLLAARELRAHGYLGEAAGLLDQRIAWHGTQPDSLRPLDRYRYEQAETLYELDRFEEARTILAELVEEFGDRMNYRGHLGVVAARLGDDELMREMDAWLESVAGDRPYGIARLWRARMAAVKGDARRAVALLQEAYREGAQLIRVVPLDHDLHTGKDWGAIREERAFRRLVQSRG